MMLHAGVVRNGRAHSAFARSEIRKVVLADRLNYARKGLVGDQDGGLKRRSPAHQRTARSSDIKWAKLKRREVKNVSASLGNGSAAT